MDANDNVRDASVSVELADIAITENVISNYKCGSVPGTCSKNKQQESVDSIWPSPDLDVFRCSFLPFHDNMYGFDLDHRLILIELCNQSLYGHYHQKIFCAPISKVKSDNPNNYEIYIEKVLERYESGDVLTCFRVLQ